MAVQRVSFFIIVALVTIAFFWLLLPYYSAILWGVILAIVFFPVQNFILRHVGSRGNLAAALSVLFCICIVIIPAMLVLTSMIQEGTTLYSRLSSREFDLNGALARIQAMLPPALEQWLQHFDIGNLSEWRSRISSAILQGSQIFAGQLLSVGQNTLQFFVSFGIMLYLLFFLFRDGSKLADTIRFAIPLEDQYAAKFLDKFTDVVRATVKGNIIIAVLQGAIGGVTFALLGIEAAVLWGVIMAMLSLLPAVGASLVWIPVALWFLANGLWLKLAIMLFVGVFIIGLIDNVLRPPLVGKGTRLPDYVILISTVGGISLIGINGFVIGPLIAALFVAAWSIMADQKHAILNNPRPPEQ